MSKAANASFNYDTKQFIANNPQLNPYRNKVINGNFDVWQYGASQTSDGYGSASRWICNNTGSTKTASRQAFTIGQLVVPGNPTYWMRHAVSSVSAAGNYCAMSQRIEDVTLLSSKTVTVSFWAKADASRNIALELSQYFGTGGSPSSVNSFYVQTCTLTTSWQYFSFVTTIPSVFGYSLGTNDDDALQVRFWFDAGSTWASRTNSLGQQSGTFDIARVSIVEGDASKETDPFYPRHIQQEVALCQRYYQIMNAILTAYGAAGGQPTWTQTWATIFRAAPTITYPATSYANASGISTVLNSPSVVIMQYTVTALGMASFNGSVAGSAEI